jgi:hypothetical protein
VLVKDESGKEHEKESGNKNRGMGRNHQREVQILSQTPACDTTMLSMVPKEYHGQRKEQEGIKKNEHAPDAPHSRCSTPTLLHEDK